MVLYLVQHAEAKTKEEDPARGLSEKGIQTITKVAQYFSKIHIHPSRILHSGKARAFQTARVLADYLKMEESVAETDGLAPMDDPRIWIDRIADMSEDVILVGHLPHLSLLASQLLCRDREKSIIDFKMAGIVCLKKKENMIWSVDWMIVPEVVI